MKYLIILLMLIGFNVQAETHIFSQSETETESGLILPDVFVTELFGKMYFSKNVENFTNGTCVANGEFNEGVTNYSADCIYFRPDGSVIIRTEFITINQTHLIISLDWDGIEFEKDTNKLVLKSDPELNILKPLLEADEFIFFARRRLPIPVIDNDGTIVRNLLEVNLRPNNSGYIAVGACVWNLTFDDETKVNFTAQLRIDPECMNKPQLIHGLLYSQIQGLSDTTLFIYFEYNEGIHAVTFETATWGSLFTPAITNDCEHNGNNPNNPHCD